MHCIIDKYTSFLVIFYVEEISNNYNQRLYGYYKKLENPHPNFINFFFYGIHNIIINIGRYFINGYDDISFYCRFACLLFCSLLLAQIQQLRLLAYTMLNIND